MSGTLTHSPADVLRQLLVDEGLCSLPASPAGSWPAYVANEPDGPDNCVTVYDTSGVSHSRTSQDGSVQEHHGIQIRVRAATFPVGWLKANGIDQRLLTGVYGQTVVVGGSTYCVKSVSRTGTVNSIGNAEDSNRQLFTVNYLIHLIEDSS